MSAPAHAVPRHACPYCLKTFATRQGVKAHQKKTRHRVEDRHEDAPSEKALRGYHHDKMRAARSRAGKPDPQPEGLQR